MKHIERVALLALCLGTGVGCGDGDGGTTPGGGSGGAATGGNTTGGVGTTGGSTTGGSTTGGVGTTGGSSSVLDDILAGRACDPAAGTTCQNETSCPEVLSGQALWIAHSAVATCAQYPDDFCIEVGVANGTTLDAWCESCYADLSLCMQTMCGDACESDTFSTACATCRDQQGCLTAFETCAEL